MGYLVEMKHRSGAIEFLLLILLIATDSSVSAFHLLFHPLRQLKPLWGGITEPNLDLKREEVFLSKDVTIAHVGDCIGSGSYGTVHLLQLQDNDHMIQCIGKRAWTPADLVADMDAKQRAARCLYYWQVEQHCFFKLPQHPQLPPYYGTLKSQDDLPWMVFGMVGAPAKSLSDYMKLDMEQESGLQNLREAMGCTTDAETLDKVLDSLLTILAHVHSHQIVHRDMKPSNLLVHNASLILLDFGSAADLEPRPGVIFGSKYWGLDDSNRVAISPIYCAPEVFVDRDNAPQAFDLFSTALLFCQLLLGYLEERTDAGFHQQLQDCNWDLNMWLVRELGSKLRPQGLDAALDYLGDRPGLWSLLQSLLQADPRDRPTAEQAQIKLRKNWQEAEANRECDDYDKIATLEHLDGPFFSMIIESMEICELPTVSRPLHFVATFSRSKPLGLVFSEVDSDDDDTRELWLQATKEADIGEVFVKEIIPGGQADELGIFEIGDRLQGIGELTFTASGFEKAVEMLQDQPRAASNVKLHFDRIRVRENSAIPIIPPTEMEITIVDQGLWSTKGRRQTQEDSFGKLRRLENIPKVPKACLLYHEC